MTITITYAGKTLNLRQWSQETGIPLHVLRNRYRRGLPPNAEPGGLFMPAGSVGRRYSTQIGHISLPIEFDGTKYTSWGQITKKTGLTHSGLHNRCREAHTTLDDDPKTGLFRPAQGSKRVFVTWRGRTQSLREWSNELNISYKALADRRRKGRKVGDGEGELFEPTNVREQVRNHVPKPTVVEGAPAGWGFA